MDGVHAAHLAGPDPDRRAPASEHDGVRAHVLADPPGEQQVLPLGLGGGAGGDDRHVLARGHHDIALLDQQAARDLAQLELAAFDGANLRKADLRGAKLHGARFVKADLRGADLRGADLSNADLSHADLAFAKLGEADLTRANLHRAKIENAELRGAKLDGAHKTDPERAKAEDFRTDA